MKINIVDNFINVKMPEEYAYLARERGWQGSSNFVS